MPMSLLLRLGLAAELIPGMFICLQKQVDFAHAASTGFSKTSKADIEEFDYGLNSSN